MDSLRMQIMELEKKVKRINKLKEKKHMSAETMQHFTKVLTGIDELNRNVLNYDGTNAFLYAKLKDGMMNSNYIQY